MGAEKFTSIAEYKPHLKDKSSLGTLGVNDIFHKLTSQIPLE